MLLIHASCNIACVKKQFLHINSLELELGGKLEGLDLCYHINEVKQAKKVVWVFHALTASSNPFNWWSDLLDKAEWLDPEQDLIICANLLGSCYGTKWDLAIDTNNKGTELPKLTIRDNIAAFELLREYLSIDSIDIGIGGSLGGAQLLEWTVSQPSLFKESILLACGAAESSWGKAAHYAQRRSIEVDPNFIKGKYETAIEGLKIARSIGMLTYRSQACYKAFQSDDASEVENYKIVGYLQYQEEKFAEHFDAKSYYILSNTLDTHTIERNRMPADEVLAAIESRSLIIGINSDMLCPIEDQEYLAKHINNAQLEKIDSIYGHDGFLLESDKINEIINSFLN